MLNPDRRDSTGDFRVDFEAGDRVQWARLLRRGIALFGQEMGRVRSYPRMALPRREKYTR